MAANDKKTSLESFGQAKAWMQKRSVFDISTNNKTNGNPTPYADLAAALGTNGAHIPADERHGGMEVRFIRRTGSGTLQDPYVDEYVQCRLKTTDFSTTPSDWECVDVTPTPNSKNPVESGGVYTAINLCNTPLINKFVADIVLKEGVDDPESENYIDFGNFSSMIIRCCYEANEFQNGIYLGSIGSGVNLIWRNYNTLAKAKEGLGVLLESNFCYVVLRDIGTKNETVNGTLTFNRDISWKSLNEHPIIKALLVEKEMEDDTTREKVSNKVTEFSQIPSNEHYPSEKLVYDSIKTPLDATVEITESRPNSNVFVLSEVGIVGGHILRYNGLTTSGGFMTGLIPVKPSTFYYLSNRPTLNMETLGQGCIRCVASDGVTPIKVQSSDKNEYRNWFLPGQSGNTIIFNGPFFVPAGATYLQMNITMPDATAYTVEETQIMLEEIGSTYNPVFVPSPYVEGGSSVVGGYKVKNNAIDFDENITPSSTKPVPGGVIYNAIVQIVEEKMDVSSIKILDLGNSFTGDATHYLKDILDAAGISTGFSLYRCTRGGSSFRTWVDLYNEEDTGKTYNLSKVAGDTILGISGGSGTDRDWFVNLLKQEWDIILIHQASAYSTKYDEWAGDGEAGGLDEYLRILRTYCPKAAIGFYIIHSYADWAGPQTRTQVGEDSVERWQNVAKAVEKLNANYDIDFIIPYGTAVQNLRMTSLNFTNPTTPVDPEWPDAGGINNDFSYDAQHMSDGIGDYVAACAYFEALFAPLFNVTVLGNSYTNTSIPDMVDSGGGNYYGRGVPVQISAANALLAQRAAILAVNDMFNLNNPESNDFIPVNSDTNKSFRGKGVPGDLSWLKKKTKVGYYTKSETQKLVNAEKERAEQAEGANAAAITQLQNIVADLETIAEGYVRVAGSSNPALSYRSYKYHEQGSFGRESVFHLFCPCLVGTKLSGNDAQVGKILFVLKKFGAKTVNGTPMWEDVNGNMHAIDGTEGDIMICNTEPYYTIDGKHAIDGTEYDVFLKSRTPFTWQGIDAEHVERWGHSPDYCISHLDTDNVQRMHSVYNPNWNGSYQVPDANTVIGKYVYSKDAETGIISETYDENETLMGGAGGCHTTDKGLYTGEQEAMNQNPDTTKCVPFMNDTAHCAEQIFAMMLSEGGTFDAHNASLMGSGFCGNDAANAAADWEESGTGAKNGLRVIDKDGNPKYFSLAADIHTWNGKSSGFYAGQIVNSWRNPWKVMEAVRAVSYAIQNDVHELEWFVFEGNKYKWRSVTGFAGPAQGEMTCVVWKMLSTKAAATVVDPTDKQTSIEGNRMDILISTALFHGITTQVSPSWWTSGLIFAEFDDGHYECYMERDQAKLIKSENGEKLVSESYDFETAYQHVGTFANGSGYRKDYSNDCLMLPDKEANKTGGGLHTYVGAYNYFTGTAASSGKKLVRGFRRGNYAYITNLSPLFVYAYDTPSYAIPFIAFGTCVRITES